MAKGGPRIGALPTLRLEPEYFQAIESYPGLLAIMAYPKSTANYWIILPPKASKLVLEYKGKRDKGPLFVQEHDAKAPLRYKGLVRAVERAAIEAGVRKVHKGDHLKRHKVMLDHGLRKFHSTTLEKAGLRDDHISRLRGSKKGLKGVYQLPTPKEVIDLTGFMQAIPLLEPEQIAVIK
jgi:integrase